MDDITCEPRELQKIIKEQLGICGGDNAWRQMQKELQNVTRINLCGDQLEQLKKQFSEMAIKTAIPSLKDDWKMTTSMAKVKELSDTLRNAAYSKEMQEFQKQLKQYNISHATELYKRELAKSWQTAVKTSAMANNRLPAQNVAFVKFIPNDVNVDMPRGAKTVVRDLTKPAAKALTETEEVEFDPKEKKFYHRDYSAKGLGAREVSDCESSLELFSEISLSEIIKFESELFENEYFAYENPVGKRIFEIISGWKTFVSLGNASYYHARCLEGDQQPYLEQEMLKAPVMVSGHGRYNKIGRSCYYFTDTKEGALAEVYRHSGNKKINVQIATLKKCREAKLIDLSQDVSKNNRFINHLRFQVCHTVRTVVKEYLLPNYVAGCCKRVGIDGIKYQGDGYNCYVTWKDDYFQFEKNEIVEA